ncbi:MAG: HDOD domain-containing protein [Proteobacteria bacterium]|nr:HDOD domain-containing protein [Pseudomonadota bacterium]
MSRADEIIDRVKQIAPLPQAALQLMRVIENPDHSVMDIVRVCESDPALTTNILKVVNSAAFGLRQPVATLERAVSFLGNKMVGSIALSVSLGKAYDQDLSGYESERGMLWKHSVCAAIAARELAMLAKFPVEPQVAYIAGLLHDLGKTVLSEFLEGETSTLVEYITEDRYEDFLDAEKESLGISHAEVGRVLGKHWNLPPPLVAAMAFHHHPAEADEQWRPLVYVVHLGDLVAMLEGSSTGADALLYHLDKDYDQFVSLDRESLDRIIVTVLSDFERTKALFS